MVAQRSVLDLTCGTYFMILNMKIPDVNYLLAYAADVAVGVISTRDADDAQPKLNQIMRMVSCWMEDHSLSFATEKTEISLAHKQFGSHHGEIAAGGQADYI